MSVVGTKLCQHQWLPPSRRLGPWLQRCALGGFQNLGTEEEGCAAVDRGLVSRRTFYLKRQVCNLRSIRCCAANAVAGDLLRRRRMSGFASGELLWAAVCLFDFSRETLCGIMGDQSPHVYLRFSVAAGSSTRTTD